MKLTPVMEKYILHWGEMGTRWGVNRTVAQIQALLFLSTRPMNAEEITETLNVARSNVSTSIRELQSWGLVKTVPVLGDRREHFETLHDPWDPTLTLLRECVLESEADKETPEEVKARIRAVMNFLDTLDSWYAQIKGLPRPTLIKLIKLGAKVQRNIGKK